MSGLKVSSLKAFWKTLALSMAVVAGLTLAGCGSAPPRPDPVVTPPPPPPTQEEPDIVLEEPDEPEPRDEEEPDSYIKPPHMEDRTVIRAALLLPFSASNEAARNEAASMLDAAQLALFERGGDSLLIIPKDTGGGAAGARAAAQSALREGADVILGPLFAESVTAAADVAWAQGVPVIAFSTDRMVAGEGAYLLSYPPEEEVEALSRYAASQGAGAAALLGPTNEYTRRFDQRLRENGAMPGGLSFATSEIYPLFNADASTAAITRLDQGRGSFGALFLTETGDSLVELAPILSIHNFEGRDTLLMGSALWRSQITLRGVASLRGALIAGPDETAQTRFENAYRAAYGSGPSRLASLAYDAVAIADHLAGARGRQAELKLANPQGFLGAGGLFRFDQENIAERALAIYELTAGGFQQVQPAPTRFPPES